MRLPKPKPTTRRCRGCGATLSLFSGGHRCPGPWCGGHEVKPTPEQWEAGEMPCPMCERVIEFGGRDYKHTYDTSDTRPFPSSGIAHLKVHAKPDRIRTSDGWKIAPKGR